MDGAVLGAIPGAGRVNLTFGKQSLYAVGIKQTSKRRLNVWQLSCSYEISHTLSREA